MAHNTDFFVVRRGAVAVPNKLVHDRELSYAALALLIVCLGLPAGAKAGYRQLKGRGLGEAAVRRGLAELEDRHLRFRFRTRHTGQLKDLTLVSYEPITVEEALAEIHDRIARGAFEGEVVGCSSHPDEFAALVDNSETDSYPQAESVEVSPLPVDNSDCRGHESEKKSEAACLTVPRSTVARWTVPRSAAAQLSKDNSKSSLRSDITNQPGVEWLDEFLPEDWLRLLGPPARARVARELAVAREAGWGPGQVRAMLRANPLPPLEQVQNPAGLIIHRVKELAASPPPAASPSRREALREIDRKLRQIVDGTSRETPKRQWLLANALSGQGEVQMNDELRVLARQACAAASERMRNPRLPTPGQTVDESPVAGGRQDRPTSGHIRE